MILTVTIQWVALLVLFVCSAFFSSAETALFSLDSIQIYRIRKLRPRRAESVERLLALPTHLLSTILIGNTIVNVSAAGVGYAIADNLLPSHSEALSIPVMTVLLLILGEVAPKRLAVSRPERMAATYAPLLIFLVRVLAPARAVLDASSHLLRRQLRADDNSLTEDEFLTVVEVGEEEGVLDEEEKVMVDGIVRLEETQASDIMTPRVDLIGIDMDDPPEERARVARSVTFHYLPVYRGTLDHAEAFLDVPRFLLSGGTDMQAAMVPSFFIPETAPLDSLLATFQRENRRVAFVVDEFGGTAGLATRGDILEEIVADVDGEYGERKLAIQKISDSRWLVDGSTSLEDVNYELDLLLEAEGADRIAGWVIAQAGHILRSGEVVTAQNCRATVQRARKNRITMVLLEKLPSNPDPEGATP